MILLLIGILLSLSFVLTVHYFVRPFVKNQYEKHEVLLWHLQYKVRKKALKIKSLLTRD